MYHRIINSNRVFPYKPSILGTAIFGNTHIYIYVYLYAVYILGGGFTFFGGIFYPTEGDDPI